MIAKKGIICVVLYLTIIVIVKGTGTHHICGRSNHNKSTGELVPHNDEIPAKFDCEWHIYPEHHKMSETFLIFEKFELEKEDECKINKHSGPLLFGPFSGKRGTFTVLTGELYLDVSVKTSNTNSGTARKFRLSYSSDECHFKIDDQSGFMASPLYKEISNRTDEVICTWEFQKFKEFPVTRIILFEEFHLINSTLEVKDADSKKYTYIGTNIPPRIVAHGGTILEMHLNTKVLGEKFTFRYFPEGINPNITLPPSEITTESEITTYKPTVITSTTPMPIIDDPTICGEKSFNDESGRILLKETNVNSFICSWDINCKDVTNATGMLISIEEFSIADNDTLTIFDSNDRILFGPYRGERNTFSIITGNLEIKLQLISKNKSERKLSISYNAKNYTSLSPPSNSGLNDEISGYSKLTLGLSIIGGIVFGLFATIGLAKLFQWYKKRREFDYGQFPVND